MAFDSFQDLSHLVSWARADRSLSQVWQDAVDMTQASGAANIQCLFHYTSELGFKNIVDARKSVVEVFVMPSATIL